MLTAALVAALESTAATAERRVSDCGERGSKTLLSNEFARVYSDSANFRWVCVYTTRVRYSIDAGNSDYDEYVDEPPFMVLAGKMLFLRYVRVEKPESYPGSPSGFADVPRLLSVNVSRLRPFDDTKSEFMTDGLPPLAKELTGEQAALEDLVVRRTGAFAAIVCPPASSGGDCGKPGRDSPRVVFSPRGRRGPGREVDRGPEIDVSSLRLRGRTVTWRKAGILKSAVLR